MSLSCILLSSRTWAFLCHCYLIGTHWDMFPVPQMLQEQLQTVIQRTDHVTIGNLNYELRFILNPVKGEGEWERGEGKLYFLCEHLTNLWNRMKEEMLNCLLFYYIYMENLTLPLVSTKRVFSLTHDCLSLVGPCVLGQPVVTDGNDWIVIVWRPGGKVNLHCTIWS